MPASRFPVLRGPDAQQSRVQDNVQSVLGPVAQALQATPIMGAPKPAWTTPGLLNGFSPAPVATYYPPSFQLDALGYARIRGVAFNAAGCAAGTVLFVLPVSVRPGRAHFFVSTDGAALRVFNVAANGEVSTAAVLAAGEGLTLECSFQVGG